ncbi:MAG: AFG1 family ATPase [Methylobacteriaceae bacterium]|nr:AFG1 family ATPase [Methylobacteriaceae bacterium]
MSSAVLDRYLSLATQGHVERDPAQEELIGRLDRLRERMAAVPPAGKPNGFNWLFGSRNNGAAVRGVYIWGPVGRGKTMLMDLFYEAVEGERKRRVHFHSFMADVHARIHAWRRQRKAGLAWGDDPIAPVAGALAEASRLLCFDEFSVTNIADAMILARLFEALFSHGVVMVATSNVDPDRLYEGGLNRALFLPFIALLKERMEIVRLDARTDFRLEKLSGERVYHVPADAAARRALDQAFLTLTGRGRGAPMTIEVLGHKVAVPQAAGGVARFSFADLCERPLGATDFLAVARHFHTLLIDGIPVIAPDRRNEAQRLIMLIDTLYDQRVKLVVSAAAEPHELYVAADGREAFEFRRTASRLVEMRSTEYLALPHGGSHALASGDTRGIAET